MNNPLQMIAQFNQFRASMQGDPQKKVQELLQSGQMSQEQFNKLQKQASDFQKMFNIK